LKSYRVVYSTVKPRKAIVLSAYIITTDFDEMTSKTLEKVGETVTFYREDVIGKGGYGCVYRGLFESREPPVRYKLPVAIKRIQTGPLSNLAHVRREMELLLKVREAPNVVHLLFYEMTTDFL